MTKPITLSGSSEQDIIDLVSLNRMKNPTFFEAILIFDYNMAEVIIDTDFGSGYQRSIESMSLRSNIDVKSIFTFHVKNKTISDRFLALLGKKIVKTGNHLFDKNLTIRTNSKMMLLDTFESADVIKLLTRLKDFNFSLSVNKPINGKGLRLQLELTETSIDDSDFREIYHAYNTVSKNIQQWYESFAEAY